MKIAVDAMGGDYAPHATVAGAVHAAREYGVGIILVGIEQTILDELRKHPFAKSLPIEVRNATEVVDMLDSPATVFRRKKDSSIRVANELVRSGEAVAVISAGNTGVAMATSLFVLGRLDGVERPAIATFMPTVKGTCIVLDVGANVDCKPNHLLQFAVMGEVYAKYVLKNPNPRVGLLSIGVAETKGLMIRENIGDNLIRKFGYLMMRPAFRALKRRIDYAEYGGMPLIGINGISIISHGRSSDRAIKNAVRVAYELAKTK